MTVVLLDDDGKLCATMARRLEQDGHDVWIAHGWANLPVLLSRLNPDALIVAEHLTGISSKHLIDSSSKHWPDVLTIVLADDPETTRTSLEAPTIKRGDLDALCAALRELRG